MFGTSDISIGSAAMYSVLGMAIVFIMLIFLWAVVELMARAVKKNGAKPMAAASEPAIIPAASTSNVPVPSAPTHTGAGGAVNDKDAAMLMAIVAFNMKKPLRELRFKSIKEVEDDEV